MVKSTTVSITPATHAANHVIGGSDPLINPILVTGHHATHEAGGSDGVAYLGTTTDVTASRAASTIYHNTTGVVMFIAVSTSANSSNDVRSYLDISSDSGMSTYMTVSQWQAYNGYTQQDMATLVAFVPNGWYYRLRVTGMSLNKWYEVV